MSLQDEFVDSGGFSSIFSENDNSGSDSGGDNNNNQNSNQWGNGQPTTQFVDYSNNDNNSNNYNNGNNGEQVLAEDQQQNKIGDSRSFYDAVLQERTSRQTDPNYQSIMPDDIFNQAEIAYNSSNRGRETSDYEVTPEMETEYERLSPKWQEYQEQKFQENEALRSDKAAISGDTKAQQELINAGEMKKGNYNDLSFLDKMKYLATPGSNIEGAPDYATWTKAALPAIMAALGGVATGATAGGAIAGVPGAVAGGIGGGLYMGGGTYLSQVSPDTNVPGMDSIINFMNKGSDWVERKTTKYGSTYAEAKKNNPDANIFELITEAKKLAEEHPLIDKAAQLGYDVGADYGLGNLGREATNLVIRGKNLITDDAHDTPLREKGQVSRVNNLIGDLQNTNPEVGGYEGFYNTVLPVYEKAYAYAQQQGYNEEQATQYADQYTLELVNNYFGTTGQLRDFTVGNVADPTNLIPVVENAAIKGIAKITDNAPLMRAAKASDAGGGRGFLGKITDKVVDFADPITQQFIQSATGSQPTKGINQTLDAYKGSLKLTSLDSLNQSQKRFGGIDEATGFVKDFEKNNTGTFSDTVKNFFSERDDSKAMELMKGSMNTLGVMMNEVQTPEQLSDVLSKIYNTGEISTESSYNNSISDTAMFKTMQSIMSDSSEKTINTINRQLDNYSRYENNRTILKGFAESLGKSEDDIVKLSSNESGRKLLSGMIEQKAMDNGGMVNSMDINTPEFQTAVDSLKVFSGDNAVPYNMTALKVKAFNTFADSARNSIFSYYNIKPDSMLTRFSNTLKSTQSLMLLGLSPSYLFNNVKNNFVSRNVAGGGGFAIDGKDFWDRMGVTSASGNESGFNDFIGQVSNDKSQLGSFRKQIKNAKTVPGMLNNISDFSSNVSSSLGLFSKLSGQAESAERYRATTIGSKNYQQATWKRGLGFEYMPDDLAAKIPQSVQKQIYSAIESSMNADELTTKLFNQNYSPSAGSIIDKAIENMPETQKTIAKNFISTLGIDDTLQYAIDSGSPKTIQNAIAEITKNYQMQTDIKSAIENLSEKENAKVIASSEGLSGVSDMYRTITDTIYSMMKSSNDTASALFDARSKNRHSFNPEEFDRKYKAQMKISSADWNALNDKLNQFIVGTAEGLGLENPQVVNYVNSIIEIQRTSQNYINQKNQLFETYRSVERLDGENYDVYKQRKQKAWEECYTNTEKLYNDTNAQKVEIQKKQNSDLVSYLKENTGEESAPKISQIESLFKQIDTLQEKITAENSKRYATVSRIDNLKTKNEITNRIQNVITRLNNQENQLYDSAYDLVSDITVKMPDKKYNGNGMSFDDTLSWTQMLEESKNRYTENMNFIQKYFSDPDADIEKAITTHDYSNKKYPENLAETGKNFDPVQLQMYQNDFINGKSVPFGSFSFDEIQSDNPIGKFELYDQTAKPIEDGICVLRSKDMLFGDNIIKGGVYEDGKLIAYLPDKLAQESVKANNNTYPVVGIDPENPNAIVIIYKDKPYSLEKGIIKGLEFGNTANQNLKPVQHYGTSSVPMPEGTAWMEMRNNILTPLLNNLDDSYRSLTIDSMNTKLSDSIGKENLPQFTDYLYDNVMNSMKNQKYRTIQYGESIGDAALLNYDKRYGFDNILTTIMPYQFWFTRSLLNWSKRMIDKPAWYSMYGRLNELSERNKKDFYPTGMNGYIGLLAPFLPKGFGDAYYIDPLKDLYPFDQFISPAVEWSNNNLFVEKKAEQKVEDAFTAGEIEPAIYYQAMNHQGDYWNQILTETKASDYTDTSINGLVGQYVSLPLLPQWILEKSKGKDSEIYNSPSSRLGVSLKGITANTTPVLETVGGLVGDALQAPEKAMRSAMGIEYNEFGGNTLYAITKQIGIMVMEGEITNKEALTAIAEGKGNTIYDKAYERQTQIQAFRTQGGPVALEVTQSAFGNKKTSPLDIASSVLASGFGAKVLSEGEMDARKLTAERNKVRATGDQKAIQKWNDNHPEYDVWKLQWSDNPEDQLRSVYLNEIFKYYDLDEAGKAAVKHQLGSRFIMQVIDRDTRNYSKCSLVDLATWAKQIDGFDPTTKQFGQIAAKQIEPYATTTIDRKNDFYAARDRMYPGIIEIQNGYYNTPQKLRNQYKKDNPELQKYWDWKENVDKAFPDLVKYQDKNKEYKNNYDKDKSFELMTDATSKALDNYFILKRPLPEANKEELQRLWKSIEPTYSFEDYLEKLR